MPLESNQTESYTCTCDRCAHSEVITGNYKAVWDAGWVGVTKQSGGLNIASMFVCAGCSESLDTYLKTPPAAA